MRQVIKHREIKLLKMIRRTRDSDYAEEVFGKEIRKWIENRIKS